MAKIGILVPGIINTNPSYISSDVLLHDNVAIDTAADFAANLKHQGIKVIITFGGLGNEIKKKVDIPVFTLERSAFDTLETIFDAIQDDSPSPVGLISNIDLHLNIARLTSFTATELISFPYKDTDSLKASVVSARKQGMRLIIGGPFTERVAKDCGLKSFQFRFGLDSLIPAAKLGYAVLDLIRNQQHLSAELTTILDLIEEGVVGVNAAGRIDFFNSNAANLMGWKSNEVLGKKIHEVVQDPTWLEVLYQGESRFALLRNARGKSILSHRTPIIPDNAITGAVSVFRANLPNQAANKHTKLLHHNRYTFKQIITASPSLNQQIERAKVYSGTNGPVLLLGESGTGKEMFAQAIHTASAQKNKPFLAINCGALPKDLLESELFGYEEGAFTGAKRRGKKGLLELASDGTLFLDEIGDLNRDLQSRLLRVIQEREFMRLGGETFIPFSARIIAATNVNLKDAVASCQFRQDLFYRLSVLVVNLPSLRDRPEDIPLLLSYFLDQFGATYDTSPLVLSETSLFLLQKHPWPGNVRELEHFSEQITVLSLDKAFDPNDFIRQQFSESQFEKKSSIGTLEVAPSDQSSLVSLELKSLEEMEKDIIGITLKACRNNQTEAAQKLGISRVTLWKKLKNL